MAVLDFQYEASHSLGCKEEVAKRQPYLQNGNAHKLCKLCHIDLLFANLKEVDARYPQGKYEVIRFTGFGEVEKRNWPIPTIETCINYEK